jgi:predicted phosphohydrolase
LITHHNLVALCRLGQLPHKHKVFVQGNHDEGSPGSSSGAIQHATNLVDELTVIDVDGRSVRIYGSPWQPQFEGWPTWLPASECSKKWDQIPDNVDVLVTHTPMLKYGDGDKGYDAGDAGLLQAVKNKRPRLSIFGHIHDGWPRAGFVPETSSPDGHSFEGTIFLNVAVTDNRAKIANAPIVFDL